MRNQTVTRSADLAFAALADPTRRAVLDLLRAGTRPAGEIARAFPISRPAISKHLKILRRAHLVDEHREGRHRFYQLNPEPLKTVDQSLDEYRRFWTAIACCSPTIAPPEISRVCRPRFRPMARASPLLLSMPPISPVAKPDTCRASLLISSMKIITPKNGASRCREKK